MILPKYSIINSSKCTHSKFPISPTKYDDTNYTTLLQTSIYPSTSRTHDEWWMDMRSAQRYLVLFDEELQSAKKYVPTNWPMKMIRWHGSLCNVLSRGSWSWRTQIEFLRGAYTKSCVEYEISCLLASRIMFQPISLFVLISRHYKYNTLLRWNKMLKGDKDE